VKVEDREMGLGGTTLEDFLVQAGLFAGASISPTVGLDAMDTAIPQSFQPKTSLVCRMQNQVAKGMLRMHMRRLWKGG
jgi:ABA responsive element binding factor